MARFEIEPRKPLLVGRAGRVKIDGSATKRGARGPAGPGADEAVQVAMSQQAGTAMRVGVNAGTVGLLVIGDSKTAGVGLTNFADRWQNRLAALMRARFPIAGGDTLRGLIPANMYDPYSAMSGRPATTGTVFGVDNAGLGYNALQMELGSVLTFPAATWPAASTLPIGYITDSGASGDLEVLVDGVVATTIACGTAGEGVPMRTSTPIAAGTHTVSMRPKAGTAPVRVQYIEQRSSATGWHLYDASRSGMAAAHLTDGPPGAPWGPASFAKAVADLPSVRLAVIALGANDTTISTPDKYGADLRGVVDMVKAGHPTAGIVAVLPAAGSTDPDGSRIQGYHSAARSALDGVPDLSILAETQLVDLTGPNAGAWLADSVHPNAFGHDVISRALAGSLIGLDVDGSVAAGTPQTLSLAGTTLTLSDGGGSVTLPSGGGTGAVSSVNGQTGAVVLNAAAVNALPSTYTPPAQSWGVITGKPSTFAPTAHTHAVTDITATGTRSSSTYLRGDGTWATPAGGGGGDGSNSAVAYAPATTSSNDTSALLAAMNAAKDAGKAFMAPPGKTYTIDPITVPQGLRIEGALSVKGRTPGQSHVLRISGSAHELTGTSLIVDANSAVDGLQLFNAGRSRFGYVDVRNAVRNGVHLMQTDGTVTTPNNNNQCSFGHVVVAGNGTKVTTSATVASQTGSPTAINNGYTTLTLSTPLPSWSPDVRVVDSGDETVLSSYVVIISGKAYRVKSVKTTTSIEIYNYPTTAAGTTLTVDILLGAGFNCPMFRDNQAGLILNIDAISNRSIGHNASSAYGWTICKGAYQGNGVGINIQNFAQAATWTSPYFELNTVDVVIGTNADMTFTSPQWSDFRLQALWDRLSSRGEGSHPGLKVIGSTSGSGGRVGPLTANEPPTRNPGTLSISPGYTYAFQRTVGNPALRIAPSKNAPLYGANIIQVALECTGTWSGTVGFSMLGGGDYFPDTVMGGSTYTTPTLSAGSYLFTIFRFDTDWRVTYIKGA